MRKRNTYISIVLLIVFLLTQVVVLDASEQIIDTEMEAEQAKVGYLNTTVTESVYSSDANVQVNNAELSSLASAGEWDSIAWKKNWNVAEDDLNGLAYGNNTFVAVGDAGAIKTSTNGVLWERSDSGTDNQIKNVVWNGSIFVAVGQGVLLTSADGMSWTKQFQNESYMLRDVAWDGSKFVVVGDFKMLTSTNGINWTSSDTDISLESIAWGKSKFVAVGHSGIIKTSSDGLNWVVSRPPSTDALADVTCNGDKFVAVGYDGIVLVSDDGMLWSKFTFPPCNTL